MKQFFLNYLAKTLRFRSSLAVPTQLGVCLTNLCNIRCPYCMRESFQVPEGVITLESLQKLLRKLPSIRGVCIMGLCEPFMNPQASEIVRWLKDSGKYSLSLTTNGMVLLTEDKLDALLRVDDLVFSIDTAEPSTFHYLRGGADLNIVMRNLQRMIEYKCKLGLGKSDNPPIHINAVITEANFHQIPSLIHMLEPYADDLTYLMIDPVSRPDFSVFKPLVDSEVALKEALDVYEAEARKSPLKVIGFEYMLSKSAKWDHCLLAWDAMFIHPNGDAYFCYNYDYILGNVFKEHPLKVWNSKSALAFRKMLQSDDPPLEQCRTCNFARQQWQLEGKFSSEELKKRMGWQE